MDSGANASCPTDPLKGDLCVYTFVNHLSGGYSELENGACSTRAKVHTTVQANTHTHTNASDQENGAVIKKTVHADTSSKFPQ